jgi:drug/metabolite transporter (DMT)-like permease
MIAEEGPTSAATVGYLLPVVSVTLGALVLNETLGLRTLAGMAVVLAGVAATRTRPRAEGAVPVRQSPSLTSGAGSGSPQGNA